MEAILEDFLLETTHSWLYVKIVNTSSNEYNTVFYTFNNMVNIGVYTTTNNLTATLSSDVENIWFLITTILQSTDTY